MKVVDIHHDEKGLVDCNNFDEEKKAKEKAEELNNKKGMNKEQVGVQRLIVIRPVDDQVPTDGNLCIDKVVQPVVDQVQGCDIKVRANAVDAAVQPINHPPHQVPPVQSDNVVSHSQVHSEQILYNTFSRTIDP